MTMLKTASFRIISVLFGALAAIVLILNAGASGSEHVGDRTCASCHSDAHEIWRESPHAVSGNRLQGIYGEDRTCLQCHVPARESGLSGVQCETCHGGGRYYFPEYVMRDSELSRLVGLKDPDINTCMECHDVNSPRLVPFDYESAREKIRHW